MPHKSGLPKSKYPKPREMGPEGQGSPGDIRDRFRGAYKPGARPEPRPPGIVNPFKKKPKPKPKPKPM